MSRYALLQSGLMPVAHAATVEPTDSRTSDGIRYRAVTRLCQPDSPLGWSPSTVPYASAERLDEVMTGPNACRTCAAAWHDLRHPDATPAKVHDADDLGTTSLLDLL